MKDFNTLQTTILGTLGEDIVINEFATSKGYTPYTPNISNKSHPIDCICISGGSIFYLDVKTKPKRKYFNDTGIDEDDYNKYMNFKKPTYILFVDRISEEIYGNWLSKLTPNREKGIVYFNIEEMQHYRNLTKTELKLLSDNERSNYWS